MIGDEDLADLIRRYIGADKETLRAYMGYYGIIQRCKRSGEGYVKGLSRKGYLEILDFMHRTSRMTWVIHAQSTLEKSALGYQCNEGLENGSIEEISISRRGIDEAFSQRERAQENRFEKVVSPIEATEKDNNNNNIPRDREIFSKESLDFCETEKPELCPEAELLLKAVPLVSEPNKAKVVYPKEEPRIVFEES